MQVLRSHQHWELLGQILYMLRHHSECSLASVISRGWYSVSGYIAIYNDILWFPFWSRPSNSLHQVPVQDCFLEQIYRKTVLSGL